MTKTSTDAQIVGSVSFINGDAWQFTDATAYLDCIREELPHEATTGFRFRTITQDPAIRKATDDNLGVRYQLMHLYVFMEDEMHALALHKQFDSYEETQMLLPLAVLYYKLNQFDKAEDYIKRLAKANKDTKKFLRAAAHDELDDYIDELNPYGYQPFTMEELLDELMKSSYLFDSVPYFFAWASKVLVTKSTSKKSTGKPHLLN